MKAAVIVFPGANCDRDCKVAIERSTGAHVDMVWHGDTVLPDGLDLIVLPGGFSYGDYLRCGAMAALSPVMTEVRAGAAVVADENGQLLGIFTHGDFVRHFQSDTKIAERLVGDLMTLNPVTVHQDKLAVEVLNLLERHRIDDLIVVDDQQAPVGMVDSQDLTKLKLL